MDFSFMLKQFLPPGVTVEVLQETGQELVKRILAAAQLLERNHELLTEQNAMLRSIVAQSQALTPSFQQEPQNDPQTLAAPLHANEPDPRGGNGPISADPATSPRTGSADDRGNGGNARYEFGWSPD